ncbi:MAG: hypothetical protein F4X56_01010 [Gammaproteobacteria bacterium]|nr:hypothetical protein [Gammaproteobacteria bacterium]MYC24480.1 hypothetical protein [Gammaproteobacteria bacterium]
MAQAAKKFAVSGLIETQRYYMLKGIPVSTRFSLDEYCTLIPYDEALESLRVDPRVWNAVERLKWLHEVAEDMSAVECRSFEFRGRKNCIERRESYLLQHGPETLALILGLV